MEVANAILSSTILLVAFGLAFWLALSKARSKIVAPETDKSIPLIRPTSNYTARVNDCLGTFGSAQLFGVSFALGAFFAGMVLAELTLSQPLFDPGIIMREPGSVLATFLIIVGGNARACGTLATTAVCLPRLIRSMRA